MQSPFIKPSVPVFTKPFASFNNNLINIAQINPTPRELDLPRFVNYAGDLGGCGWWRILWPEYVLNTEGRAVCLTNTAMVLDPRWYAGVKAVRIQRQASGHQKEFIKFLKQVQQQHGFRLIYDSDDVVFAEEIPDYNKFKFAFDTPEIRQNCIDIMNMCDEITVSCEFMRKLYQEKTGKREVTVVPNFIPHFWMGYQFNAKNVYESFDKNKRKPRVLYTGSAAHYDVDHKNNGVDDFSHVLSTVINTVDKYQWVFVGAFPLQLMDLVNQKKIEFHPWQSLLRYPTLIANLNVQAMIAPLMDNNFNRCKSDIKFIEACSLGIPCLVQDMETYKNAPDVLKFKTGDELEAKLDMILNWKNRSKYYKNVDVLRSFAFQRYLEHPQNIDCHMEVLTTPYGSPERKNLSRYN